MKTRTCYICEIDKPLDKEHFYAKKTDREGFMWRCKNCDNKKRNGRKPKGYNRKYNLKYYYGLTEEQYKQIFESQQGLCPICNKPPLTNERLAVEHDHVTKEVRGLVHRKCNRGLGFLGDDPNNCDRAAKFLRENKTGIFIK